MTYLPNETFGQGRATQLCVLVYESVYRVQYIYHKSTFQLA